MNTKKPCMRYLYLGNYDVIVYQGNARFLIPEVMLILLADLFICRNARDAVQHGPTVPHILELML